MSHRLGVLGWLLVGVCSTPSPELPPIQPDQVRCAAEARRLRARVQDGPPYSEALVQQLLDFYAGEGVREELRDDFCRPWVHQTLCKMLNDQKTIFQLMEDEWQ